MQQVPLKNFNFKIVKKIVPTRMLTTLTENLA